MLLDHQQPKALIFLLHLGVRNNDLSLFDLPIGVNAWLESLQVPSNWLAAVGCFVRDLSLAAWARDGTQLDA